MNSHRGNYILMPNLSLKSHNFPQITTQRTKKPQIYPKNYVNYWVSYKTGLKIYSTFNSSSSACCVWLFLWFNRPAGLPVFCNRDFLWNSSFFFLSCIVSTKILSTFCTPSGRMLFWYANSWMYSDAKSIELFAFSIHRLKWRISLGNARSSKSTFFYIRQFSPPPPPTRQSKVSVVKSSATWGSPNSTFPYALCSQTFMYILLRWF